MMETTNDQEKGNTDSKETLVTNSPKNTNVFDQSLLDCTKTPDSQEDSVRSFTSNDVRENRDAVRTETDTEIEVREKEIENVVAEPVTDDGNENNGQNVSCDNATKPTFSDSDEQKSHSSTSKAQSQLPHDQIEQNYVTNQHDFEIMGGKNGELKMLESDSKDGTDFETSAAVITQQNYENTLRYQSQDFKTEIKENNYSVLKDDEDNTANEKENTIDSLEDNSMDKSDSHDVENDNVKTPENDVCSRRGKECLEFKHESNTDQSDNLDKDEQEVVMISDEDSCQSITASENNTKPISPEILENENYFNEDSPKQINKEREGEIINLDGDLSQTSDQNFKDLGNTKAIQVEEFDKGVIQRLSENNDNSKESEISDENTNDDEVSYVHNEISDTDIVDRVEKINNERTDVTKADGHFIIKRKETSKDEKINISINKNELKVNGDHHMTSSLSEYQINENSDLCTRLEGEIRNDRGEDKMTANDDKELNIVYKAPSSFENQNIAEMDVDSDNKDELFSRQLKVMESDFNRVNCDDENSHCSSVASVASNSTDTSSSQQLVIDHPMEEIDTGLSVPDVGTGSAGLCVERHDKTDKVNSIKLSLKRKMSSSSETGLSPQHKQPHIEPEPVVNENISSQYYDVNINVVNEESSLPEPAEKQQATEISGSNYSDTAVEHPPFKSLLFQHLQKPYIPPPPPDNSMSAAADSLFSLSLEKTPFSITTTTNVIENIDNPTKYLCFKCKTGSFHSFEALNEHQRECLADTRLLPARIAEISSLLPLSLPPILATPPPSASPDATMDMNITKVVSQAPASMAISATASVAAAQKKRYYKCSSCNTFHENWNLFLHIRDKHQRHMCLYCIRFFPTAEKLSVHLEIKHDLEQNHFHSEEALRNSSSIVGEVASETRFLMCCTCQHLFQESEPFSDHNCAEFMKPCTLCGQKGRHSNHCKAHPDGKRTLKTKKKSKKLGGVALTPIPNRNHNSLLSVSLIDAASNATPFNCDSNQNSVSTLLAPTVSESTLRSEDSNSSSNMVIDESCTTTHSSLVNPFKELDERWRLEQQTQNQNETNTFPPARTPSPIESNLTVPKFKLRVPKEFQKSVDVALSSTDSEEDEDDVGNEEEDNEYSIQGESSSYKNDIAVTDKPSGFPNDSVLPLHADSKYLTVTSNDQSLSQKRFDDINSQETLSVDKSEWVDESNSNLVRILKEIERTKLDIQRTKETLHHPPKAKQDHTAGALTSSSHTARNWTPTPPTSPKQARLSISGEAHKKTSPCLELMKVEQQVNQPLQRRDSAGSEAMDIDETINGAVPELLPRQMPEGNLELSTGNTKQEMNTSIESNFSENLLNNSVNTVAGPKEDKKLVDNESPLWNQKNELSSDESATKIDTQEAIQHMQSGDLKEDLLDAPEDGIELANEDVLVVDLQLDRPLEKIEIVEFIRICLKAVYPICLYCNHARRIAVNGKSLVLHMLAQHRFSAIVDSITAEELKPETICAKLKTFLPLLENEFFNSTSYCTLGEGTFTRHFNERIFECFQCRFVTSTHKELYLHNRKMHLKTAILCFMCRANFFSFSEILCHICPGAPNKTPVFDVKFRCCLCDFHNIPSPFRLMVHLRKRHFACDVCLEDCRDQGRLSSHVWKHKLHHLCYRCGIAYRNKMDITKHLFWKHGTESIICKRCLQKRWRHVYHFCVPPNTFNCEVCNLCFSKAMYLKVHKRLHSGDLRYPCTEENCDEKFISRKLLLKHTATHLQQESLPAGLEQSRDSDGYKKVGEDDEESEIGTAKKGMDLEKLLNKTGNSVEIKEEASVKSETDAPVKCEEGETDLKSNKTDDNTDMKNPDIQKGDGKTLAADRSMEAPRKKKKKNKRSKESLEDLNLIAPNLSETDSSEESDVDSKSRGDENSLVPKVMLSPPSETENDIEDVKKIEVGGHQECGNKDIDENGKSGTGKVLDIWKNFLQAQQSGTASEAGVATTLKKEADYDEENYPTPYSLHVVYSDHDYCRMFRPRSPVQPAPVAKPALPLPSLSLAKRNKASKSPRRATSRRSASSTSSDSSSSSDSSCSCGSNCSCSTSGSGSSSSSSSSNDSDSSVATNASRKRHRKKSERERLRKKSDGSSPLKKHINSETLKVVDDDLANEIAVNTEIERPPSPPKEPQIYESDLETAESETDEEFYDEHPQKLASELLAHKRAQLMAQTRLSPSHNFDIVENSRPSTPSLPEDVVCETRIKLKKKKRDRKSSCKSNLITNTSSVKAKGEKDKSPISVLPSVSLNRLDRVPCYELAHPSPTIAELPMAQQPNVITPYSSLILPASEQLTPRPLAPHQPSRMSEGSSCSDADGSLKRSKRARRPNKFYGYTSDDETAGINLGQPLMMGMRTIKPQPPPQLTWLKEDLPTPAKSIMNQKHRTPRTPKTPGTPVSCLGGGLLNSTPSASSKKKCTTENTEKSSARKRTSKKTSSSNKLPPIPTLKIRPSQLGISNDGSGSGTGTELFPTPQIYSSSKDTDDEDDEIVSSEASSDIETETLLVQTNTGETMSTSSLWNSNLLTATPSATVNTQLLQASAPQPVLQTPQTTVFNHKIPPALLPNPNFETLQYFKANNIRYPIRPPAGARQAREGESVYCYCRCPYDEVSEMIACDGENCLIEWFHFECVGIMVAPQGKWFCAECRPKYSEELYPTSGSL
ncbi:uncharacterized protein LOC118742396 [Rhagoletis pomonella]|uniref:uncharacterized protein LOC118742396 n=1 Tax=Rhagoletis pomonella TaxID=28610 RepID=UPI00177FD5C6|nr:uncharacterized protein LOC118742396 [Rhagoletis pomonella]